MTNNEIEVCPTCESEITESNPLIEERYSPERYGGCVDCYDPTPMFQWEVTEGYGGSPARVMSEHDPRL
jgi:hypothetical protein